MFKANRGKQLNYIFAPKLDAAALARDTSLMSFALAAISNSLKNDPKPIEFDHNSR